MDWKKLAGSLLFPPAGVTALLAAGSAAALIYSAIQLDSTHPVSIAAYALSFYALILVCLRVPRMIACIRQLRRQNQYYLRYVGDVRLRMQLSLWGAFAWNACYAVFQLALGVYHRSAWFCVMAAYYALLGGMRLMLGMHMRAYAPGEKRNAEWQRYRLCGIGLALTNIALSVFIAYYVRRLRIVAHHEITVIAMAAYTFGALTLAIIQLVRYRRWASPACRAAKALSLACACISMLSLENSMLTVFSRTDQPDFQRIMLAISGAAVSVLILSMAAYMIVKASKNLKECKKA